MGIIYPLITKFLSRFIQAVGERGTNRLARLPIGIRLLLPLPLPDLLGRLAITPINELALTLIVQGEGTRQDHRLGAEGVNRPPTAGAGDFSRPPIDRITALDHLTTQAFIEIEWQNASPSSGP